MSAEMKANKSKLAKLNEIFKIEHGNKFDLNKMIVIPPSNNAIAFIGRSGEENGIVAFVQEVEGRRPFEEGCITVALGGLALSSFVQSRPFYTAQNIDVLIPLVEMSIDVKLYYCLCIEANKFRYSTFGREANRTLKNLLIPELENIPNWVEGMSIQAINELKEDLEITVHA